jgi:hypothetical protein
VAQSIPRTYCDQLLIALRGEAQSNAAAEAEHRWIIGQWSGRHASYRLTKRTNRLLKLRVLHRRGANAAQVGPRYFTRNVTPGEVVWRQQFEQFATYTAWAPRQVFVSKTSTSLIALCQRYAGLGLSELLPVSHPFRSAMVFTGLFRIRLLLPLCTQ